MREDPIRDGGQAENPKGRPAGAKLTLGNIDENIGTYRQYVPHTPRNFPGSESGVPNWPSSRSADERSEINALWSEIDEMDKYLRKFEYALKLYRYALNKSRSRMASAHDLHSEIARVGRTSPDASILLAKCQSLHSESKMFRSWAHTAARDGAMTLYHLSYLMLRTWSKIEHCGLFDRKDVTATRGLAENAMEGAFPAFMAIWSTLVHDTENTLAAPNRNVDSIATRDCKSDIGLSLFLGGVLEGDFFQVAHEHHIHGYHLYQENLLALRQSVSYIKRMMSMAKITSFSN